MAQPIEPSSQLASPVFDDDVFEKQDGLQPARLPVTLIVRATMTIPILPIEMIGCSRQLVVFLLSPRPGFAGRGLG